MEYFICNYEMMYYLKYKGDKNNLIVYISCHCFSTKRLIDAVVRGVMA